MNCGSLPTYADDATFLFASNSRNINQSKLTDNLKKIKIFLNDHSLSMNESKTTLLELMVRQKRVRINGSPPSILTKDDKNEDKLIVAGEQVRLLGGNLHFNLSWRGMIETGEKAILPTLRKKLGALKHAGKMVPTRSKKILANGFILSRINYLIQVWGGTEAKYIRKLQTMLNATARYVTGACRRTSTRWLMTQCNWLYVSELVILHSLTTLWKVVWFSAPTHLRLQITVDNNMIISTAPDRLKITARSFTFRSVRSWNSLPDEIRLIGSLPRFKNAVKKWLIASRSTPG